MAEFDNIKWEEIYPILTSYINTNKMQGYATIIRGMIKDMVENSGVSSDDAYLILKEMLELVKGKIGGEN